MTLSPTAGSEPGIWLSLETVLSLPLEPAALAVVWREILQQLPSQVDADQERFRERLLAALQDLELHRALECCRRGAWSSGLSQLERAMAISDFGTILAPALLEILPELHYQLIDLAEDSPSQCPFSDEERRELLWSTAVWLRRINASGIAQSERMAAIHEQIYRYGALAWMEHDSPLARSRSLTLLLALSEVNPEALPWTWPACRERVSAQLQEMEEGLNRESSAQDVLTDLRELIHRLDWFAGVFSQFLDGEEAGFARKLADAKACLQVWQQLSPDASRQP